MIARIFKSAFVVLLYCSIFAAIAFGDTVKFKDSILHIGTWGGADGEFGKEEQGKTEQGYSLNFTVYNRQIFIYDAMNNRIQVFDLNGRFVRHVVLKFDWVKSGVGWQFAMLENNYFAFVGRPPFYSFMNSDIYKISPNGDILIKFGNKQINSKKEEYFSKIRANDKSGHLFCSIGGSSSVAVYDSAGNFLQYLTDIMSAPEIVLNSDGQIVKNPLPGYAWIDDDGNYYRIKSSSSRKAGYAIITKVQIHSASENKVMEYQITGDVNTTRSGKPKHIRYSGNFMESSFVDKKGTIYHLIALDDGVVLRQIEWKAQ